MVVLVSFYVFILSLMLINQHFFPVHRYSRTPIIRTSWGVTSESDNRKATITGLIGVGRVNLRSDN